MRRFAVGLALLSVALANAARGQTLDWTLMTGLPSCGCGFNAGGVWASGPNDVFLVGGLAQIDHFDGTSWSLMPNPYGANRYQVYGTGPNNVYSVGQNGYQSGLVEHYDGTSWGSALYAPGELTALYALSPSAVFVGGDGIFDEFDGSAWNTITTGLSTAFNTDRITSIWANSPTDVYLAGYGDILLHYNGVSVTSVSPGSSIFLEAVSGTSSSDIFAVGASGIYHFDGSSWTQMSSPSAVHLFSVDAIAPDDVYASGADGTLLHYDGTSWSQIDVGTTLGITDVYAVSPDLVYASVQAPDAEILIGQGTPVTTTPEPGTLTLVAAALGGMSISRLRRRPRLDRHR